MAIEQSSRCGIHTYRKGVGAVFYDNLGNISGLILTEDGDDLAFRMRDRFGDDVYGLQIGYTPGALRRRLPKTINEILFHSTSGSVGEVVA